MADYRDGHAEARLLRRTIVESMDFDGRSRRTEWLFYSIATTLAGTLIGFVGDMILPGLVAVAILIIWTIAAILPTFALFCRRMHDQDRSGAWTFVYVANVLMQIISAAMVPANSAWFQHPFEWISAGLFLAVLVLILLPGTKGRNSYGADPRISEP